MSNTENERKTLLTAIIYTSLKAKPQTDLFFLATIFFVSSVPTLEHADDYVINLALIA
jgi:hypothetical protein